MKGWNMHPRVKGMHPRVYGSYGYSSVMVKVQWRFFILIAAVCDVLWIYIYISYMLIIYHVFYIDDIMLSYEISLHAETYNRRLFGFEWYMRTLLLFYVRFPFLVGWSQAKHKVLWNYLHIPMQGFSGFYRHTKAEPQGENWIANTSCLFEGIGFCWETLGGSLHCRIASFSLC